MQLDLTLSQDSFAHHQRAADEQVLEILALIESGMCLMRIDRKFGLAAGAAMKIWSDVCDACSDFVAVH